MSVKIEPPRHDAHKRCYIFTFQDVPTIQSPSARDIPFESLPHAKQEFLAIVEDFLTQASPYFSKPLQTPLFLQRLVHTWNVPDDCAVPTTEEPLRATWIPAKILFYTSQYEIHWRLLNVEVEPAQIPPGFLEEEDEGVDSLQTEKNELPEMTEKVIEASLEDAIIEVDAIPFAGETTDERKRREKDKQRIRQARLRVTLAKLRAERLAERYFRRYGTFEGVVGDSDSDSELSTDSEGAHFPNEV